MGVCMKSTTKGIIGCVVVLLLTCSCSSGRSKSRNRASIGEGVTPPAVTATAPATTSYGKGDRVLVSGPPTRLARLNDFLSSDQVKATFDDTSREEVVFL